MYSQELTAAKFQQKLSSKGEPKPDAAFVAELQRCQAGLHQRIMLARTQKHRDRLQHDWGNLQLEEVPSELQVPGDTDSAGGAARS